MIQNNYVHNKSTDDILQVEGNKAVVMENNTSDDEETDSDLQEEQAALDRKQENDWRCTAKYGTN